MFVSKNFKFGFKRRGSVSTLKKFEKIFNYTNVITKPFKKRGKIISSTLIRKTIRAGRIDIVNKLASESKRVVIAGLDKDYMGKSFGPIINTAKTTTISISNHPICGI